MRNGDQSSDENQNHKCKDNLVLIIAGLSEENPEIGDNDEPKKARNVDFYECTVCKSLRYSYCAGWMFMNGQHTEAYKGPLEKRELMRQVPKLSYEKALELAREVAKE